MPEVTYCFVLSMWEWDEDNENVTFSDVVGHRVTLARHEWETMGQPAWITTAIVQGDKVADPPSTVHVYKNEVGQWRTRTVAGNNRIIFNSGEGYHNKADAVDIAQANFLLSPIEED